MGAPLDADRATIYHVGLEREIGTLNPVKLALPIILPALIKLNWPDYFGGAAMAGDIVADLYYDTLEDCTRSAGAT